MNPRPTETQSNEHSESTSKSKERTSIENIAYGTGRILIVGPTVAFWGTILDVFTHTGHTHAGNMKSLFYKVCNRSYVLAASKAAVVGYPKAAQASTYKNIFLAQRSSLEEKHLESREIVEAREREIDSNESLSNKPPIMAYYGPVAIAATLGVTETAFTQLNSNKRAWIYQHELTKNDPNPFQIPEAKSKKDTVKMFKIGCGSRCGGNVVTIGGYIYNPKINDYYRVLFPADTFGQTANYAGTFTSGILFGAMSNVFTVLYKEQTGRTKASTITTDSTYTILKDRLPKERHNFFLRGLPQAIFSATFYYYTVPHAEKFADKVLEKATQFFTQAKDNVFFKSVVRNVREEMQRSVENREQAESDYHCASFNPFK